MADRCVQSTTTTMKKKKKNLSTLMLQNEQYSACLSKRGLASRRSHICFARLGLPSWTLGKKNTSLFCAALPLTSCFWRMCGKPRLAFCCPFKFKIQSAGLQQELRPHRGAGTNSSSWHTWRYPFLLFCFRLLLLPLLLLTPAFLPHLPLFIPQNLQYRAVMLSVTDMQARKCLVRAPS